MQAHTTTRRHMRSARAGGPRRVAGALAVLALAGAASGQFSVNIFYDAPAVNPAAGCDVDPAAPGDQCSLRSVIQHINTLPPGAYTVDVPAGGYVLNVAGHGEDLGAAGDLDVLREITIRGAGVGRTAIDASALGDRIFDLRAPVALALRDLRMVGGTAVPGAAGVEPGGGIRGVAGSAIDLASVHIENCSATGGTAARGGAIATDGDIRVRGDTLLFVNSATGIGGAIYLAGSGVIDGAWFDGNRSDRDGGAIRTSAGATLDITGATFHANRSGASGGALNVRGPTTVQDSVFRSSRATGVGGAIGASASLAIVRCHFLQNRTDSGGGALNVAGLGDANIRACHFEDNYSVTSGGAITNSWDCTIANSTFARNLADGSVSPNELGGGAIYNFRNLSIVNSTFSANRAPAGYGGAIHNLTGGDADLAHVTFADNSALIGNTINNGTPAGGSTMTLTHTILSDLPHLAPGVTGTVPLVSGGYNFDADGSAALAGPGDIGGAAGSPVDPRLEPLDFYGGPTPTHHLAPGSPCRDAGDNIVSPVGGDQRGHGRPARRPQTRPDIGAIEQSTGCYPDCDDDGALTFFDLLCFQGAFAASDPYADCDLDGLMTFFDLLCFQAEVAAGCPLVGVAPRLTLLPLGTGAPPTSLYGAPITMFPPDHRLTGASVSTVDSPSHAGGVLRLSPACSKRIVGSGWGTWSHGFTGNVYYTNGAANLDIEVIRPSAGPFPSNRIFLFYVQPNPFAAFDFEVTGEAGGFIVSALENISGAGGAAGFAFLGGVERVNIQSFLTVTDFAVGEFGIAE